MYRSWAYILMIVATLVGVVALLWPSPAVRTIEDIATIQHAESAPRAEPAAKSAKSATKPAAAPKPAPKPAAPPSVVQKMPAPTTSARRAAPVLQNGLQPGLLGQPAGEWAKPPVPPSAAARPGAPVTARPTVPPRPSPEPGQAAPK